uniref:Uncharacterized protein n=1 Tax=Meloidogyne hapla TaxID=6305 RepID=A0A1I8BZK7_MELHA
MLFILIFYLALFQSENSKFSKADPKDQLERDVEKIAEYILFNKNVQTDIYAEKVRNSLVVQRGFHEDNVKNLKITWDDMKKTMEKTMEKLETKAFFKRTKHFFICKSYIVFTSCKLNFARIFESIKSKYLKLSHYYADSLQLQSRCLAKFFVKTYGIGNVIGMKSSELLINEEKAIQFSNSVKHLNELFVIRWYWEKTRIPENFPNLKYDKGTVEFEELEKCNKLLRFVISNPNL